ncbi:MAG: hypothetical protein JWO38_5422 [Gemmataceae bacterium]|nr:hypothetical protein [Gemmataceae bacterium]
MLLFCPACQSAFTGVSRCPRCGGLLLTPEESPALPEVPGHAPPALLHPTPAGRVLVGMVVAFGLYLGLRKLTIGWLLATVTDPDAWWLTPEGLVGVFGLQAGAVLFGSVLAAAGRVRGSTLGAAVGGLCGGLFLTVEIVAGAPSGQLVLLLQPLILSLGGAIAGVAGAWVWAAVPELDMPVPAGKKQSSIQLNVDAPGEGSRPTVWLRVGVGVAVIVAGVGLAEKVRGGAEKVSGGILKVESRGQARFLSWQIATLAVLAGGAWAGAGTGAGLRHGVYAGLLGGLGVVGLTAARGELSQPAEYLLSQMNLAGASAQDPAALAGLGCGILAAGLVGGWFGGQLFLPLAPVHMRNRKLRLGGD